jgi:hypothetical protein
MVSALCINHESSSNKVFIWMLILATPIVNSDMSSFLRTLFSNQNQSNLCQYQSVCLFVLFDVFKNINSVWNICCSWRGLNVKCHLKYRLTWWQQFKWKLWYQIQIYLINLKEMGICRLWKCTFPLKVYLKISQNCVFLQSPLKEYRITECKCSLASLVSAQSDVLALWRDLSSSSSVMPWSTKHKKLMCCHHHRKSDRIQRNNST